MTSPGSSSGLALLFQKYKHDDLCQSVRLECEKQTAISIPGCRGGDGEANVLAEVVDELLGVRRVELLEQRQHADHKWCAVDWLGLLCANLM